MTSLYQTVKACIIKTPVSEQVEVITTDTESELDDTAAHTVKEHDAQDFMSDKKTDMQSDSTKPAGGMVWRVSSGLGSGLYNVTAGAVGYGVGGVKWVAGKSYDVGASVASHVHVPQVPAAFKKKKDKKE